MINIHYIVQTTTTATTATTKEIKRTAPMDGLDSSRGPGCDTPAPKKITGFWNILGGLNIN